MKPGASSLSILGSSSLHNDIPSFRLLGNSQYFGFKHFAYNPAFHVSDFHLILEFESAGQIWAADDIDISKPDTYDIMHIAECFARMGCIVKIPRPVHFKSNLYEEFFGGLKGTKYEKKCPDLCIDGKYYEYESYVRPWNKRKLSNMLSDGLRQSDRIIIDNRGGASIRQIIRAINNRLHVNASIAEVWIYDGDSVIDIYP